MRDSPHHRTVTAWRHALDDGWTTRGIAGEWGVTHETVLSALIVASYRATESRSRTAADLGLSEMVVRDRLWRAGLVANPRGPGSRLSPDEDPAERRGPRGYEDITIDLCVEMYRALGSYHKVAAELGVSGGVVRLRLHRAGILAHPNAHRMRGQSSATR